MDITENRKIIETSSVYHLEQARTSLKDVPIEERRKEADKPLYLTRYE